VTPKDKPDNPPEDTSNKSTAGEIPKPEKDPPPEDVSNIVTRNDANKKKTKRN
jgi:hypothetical protein